MPRKSKGSSAKGPHGHKSGGKGGGGAGYRSAIGASDQTVAVVGRGAQAPKAYHLKWLTPFATDAIVGDLVFVGSAAQYAPISGIMSASAGWTDLVSGGYDQFYVKGFHARFVPANRYSKVTAITASFTVGLDVDSATVSLTEIKALDYGTAKVLSLDDPAELYYSFPAPTTAGFVWYDVATPTQQPGCFFAAHDGIALSTSTAYGTWYFDVEVVARGRR